MSETKKANTNRKIFHLSKLKINRISLLNQSNLNVPLKQLYISKSKIRNMIKEINNNKSDEKQFNVFFNPIRKPSLNINYRENSNKLSPLSEKRKIVRKHNILQNIDFNMNLIQGKSNKSIDNKSLELNLNNNKFKQSSFSRNNDNTFFNNKNKSSNSNNNLNISKKNNDFDKTINLPILRYGNEESIHNLKQNNYNNYKTNSPLKISSPMSNSLNILKKYNTIFTKKSQSKDRNKNENENEINKYNSYYKNNHNLNLKKNYEYNNNNNEEIIKISEHIEESTSNDNNFDMKEIENIISNSSNNVKINKKSNYYRNNNNNKNVNRSENEINIKKDIFLNGLQQIKKENLVNISNNKIINEIINDRIEIPPNTNKVSQGTNTDRTRNINSFYQSNINNENKSYRGLNMNIHKDKELLPYNYKKNNFRNNRTNHFHNSNNTNYFPKFY